MAFTAFIAFLGLGLRYDFLTILKLNSAPSTEFIQRNFYCLSGIMDKNTFNGIFEIQIN